MSNTPYPIAYEQLAEENSRMKTELDKLRLFYSELESTNNHLISATWRERDMKKKLAETIEELNKTKLIVENQNKRITESINYARKIQLAINATENDLGRLLPSSFIFYLPKDVISGDFPWLFHKEHYLYVASVDCTGHGVPGAMMSMIGNLLLNDIVKDQGTPLPSEILGRLHAAVVNTLKQEAPDSNSNDGMDIALVRIDLESKEIVFSGAHRPLLVDRKNGIETISADKFPIGGIQYKGKNRFTDHSLGMQPGERIFLFSDGMPDQIGGAEKRKLMLKGIRDHFSAHTGEPMETLRKGTEELFFSWKGEQKQIDDILVIGIEF